MSFGKKLRHTLLRCGQVISAEHGATLMIMGRRCANSTTFFSRLENGEDVTIGTAEVALAWLSHHWPADREWPKSFFDRPAPKDVRRIMESLPEDRRIVLIPRRGRAPSAKKPPHKTTKKPERSFRNLLNSPPFQHAAAARTAPALTESPPVAAGVGASLERSHSHHGNVDRNENEHEQHKG